MKRFLLTTAFLLMTGSAFAGSTSGCPQLYPDNFNGFSDGAKELCNSFYAVRFDETHNVPLESLEVLQPVFTHTKRVNDFHPDERLNKDTRAENTDYQGSGFDKGHMTPAEDAAIPTQMYDTFLLSNMTPQHSQLNRINWAHMEEAVHQKVVDSGKPTHIITGAIYNGYSNSIGKHHIAIPVAYYKIVYLASGTIAYYADNTDTAQVTPISIPVLQKQVPFIIE